MQAYLSFDKIFEETKFQLGEGDANSGLRGDGKLRSEGGWQTEFWEG